MTPNFFTIAALLASAAAGILFYLRLELWGIVAVALNAFCDAMDGAVAREMKIQSNRGDFLDHAVDRYADIFIITGIFAGGLVPWQIGVFALTGVLMSSYLGTQAQAVGVGRYYGGLLGRADRLVLIMVVGIIDLLVPMSLYGLTLAWLAAGALRRFRAYHRIPAVRVCVGEGGVISLSLTSSGAVSWTGHYLPGQDRVVQGFVSSCAFRIAALTIRAPAARSGLRYFRAHRKKCKKGRCCGLFTRGGQMFWVNGPETK
ncbi:MAG: CDP-alcohol phosphatidyltransferase family protein [Desulfobacterales bacterium]|nr:CDP-alcohol phosphatidyltransferase family protein [Desulfobacterales bacterium]